MSEIPNPGIKVPTFEPLWLSNLELPRNRATINAWSRSFYALDPTVNRIINQHALLLTSAFELTKIKSKSINDFVSTQIEMLKIPNMVESIIKDYFICGEAFLYLEMHDSLGMWSKLTIQNPDYAIVKRGTLESQDKYYLRPDENLRRICFSNEKKDIEIKNMLNDDIVNTIKNRENILLDSFYITHIANKLSPYEIRGTSLLLPLFETLKQNNRDENTISKIEMNLFDIKSFNNKEMAADIIMARYTSIINQLEHWFNIKLLKPIYVINKFDKKILPQVKFNKDKLKKLLM